MYRIVHGFSKNLDQISLPAIITQSILEFSTKIRREFPNQISQIILFGSYARGDYHDHSDVDILVVTTDDTWDLKKGIMDAGFYFYFEMGVLITARVMTEQQYKKTKEYVFMKEVARDGVAIV